MDDILHTLHKDKRFSQVLKTTPLRVPTLNDDVYLTLLKSIVEQQVSTQAAATIWGRFLKLWSEYPHPEDVLQADINTLQGIGTSFQKAGYLKNIAQFAVEGGLDKQALSEMDNSTAIKHLSQVKGVGKWTAEMILMFSLGREDVFPVDDLIVRNAMVMIYEVKSEKKALIQDLEKISMKWRPYRSYACFVLWDWYEGQVKGRKLYGT